jgi:hypothetical protein
MGLKQYIIGSFLLVLAVAGFTFTILPGDFRLEVFSVGIVLPIAVWIILPVVVLFVLSLLHMIYYGIKKYMYIRSMNKDEETLVELVRDLFLQKKPTQQFKTDAYKEIGLVLSQLDLTIKNADFHSNVKDLTQAADIVLRIKSGKYVPQNELKLPIDNNLMQENMINKIDIDDNFCTDVLKDSSKYTENIIKKAFYKALDTKGFITIKQLYKNIKLDKDMVKALIKKDADHTSKEPFSNSEIIELIRSVDFSVKDYIDIATEYKQRMLPDQLIKLFEEISADNDNATEGYLYVLFEYEMIDDIRALLSGSKAKEFKAYKALLDLKDAGKHYNINHICHIS